MEMKFAAERIQQEEYLLVSDDQGSVPSGRGLLFEGLRDKHSMYSIS